MQGCFGPAKSLQSCCEVVHGHSGAKSQEITKVIWNHLMVCMNAYTEILCQCIQNHNGGKTDRDCHPVVWLKIVTREVTFSE